MPEFLELIPPREALNILLAHGEYRAIPETIQTVNALGRVTASPVLAPYSLPSFPRSTVDGYAVRARDTFGAGEALPAYLNLVGEIPMGAEAQFALHESDCALIHTGGMIPNGADAVVMVEYTQSSKEGEIEIARAVAPGENVLAIGEDVQAGDEVIPAGVRLRPAEIGGLMALGFTQVQVAQCPRVGIISSGDEVILPEAVLSPGQVRDVNSYTLSALVSGLGGEPRLYGIVPDQQTEMFRVAEKALSENELVMITAGSSASARDLTALVINQLGEPGVLVHGVNIRPGKPTILAVCGGKTVIGLPGNPVSALVIASLFVAPVIEGLLGLQVKRPKPMVTARLSLNLASQTGREDWIAVRVEKSPAENVAVPVFGKSNLIFTLARADGLIRIPADATGLSAGEIVEVVLI